MMGDEPFSCQVFGDIVDFRKPLPTIKEEIARSREPLPPLPVFEESLRTLDRAGGLVADEKGRLAAEEYPECGPHNETVCT